MAPDYIDVLANVEAVLCDMDGTLVDSDAAVERSWDRWCELTGTDRESLRPISPGIPSHGVISLLYPGLDEYEVNRLAQLQLGLQYDDISDTVAAEGAHQLVEVLNRRALPWAVVTSADRRLAEVRLAATAISAPLVVTSEDVSRGKPNPDCYLLAAKKLGVRPGQCLVVEDAPAGIAAGRAAGALVAGLRGVGGDLTIPDLGYLAQGLAAAT